ncbi:MAG: outer membrane protein assembly factor BamD [Candidatus Paracaedibacteraceae bacterium]|nr:outer membrane protein assembly factor BamD [Candidatus Paracaedibacteraceae bacterium]
MQSSVNKLLLALTATLLISCSDKDDEVFAKMPVGELYTTAKSQMDSGSYNLAAKTFAEVERQHPYSEWSLKAQLMSAYCYYEAKKYNEAIEGYNVFIQLHPGHENIPYAYYMVGLCYYEQIPTVQRDQTVTEKAQEAFREVMNRFPDSPYARDAKFKMDLLRDHLAGKEMDVGRYYLRQRSYLAAVNRFKEVVDRFQTTSHVPEALHRMVECYLALGLLDQAQQTAAILGHNFPGSPWYADTYTLIIDKNPKIALPKKQALKADVKPDHKVTDPKPPLK